MLHKHAGSRSGFTLIEILVALILIALLLGAVVPAVMNQVTKGDTNRVLEDLSAVSTGMQTFRMDVRRWPGELDQLITSISTTSSTGTDINGDTYSTGMANKWAGSYLDGVTLTPSSTLITGAEGEIQNAFQNSFTLNDEAYMTIVISKLPESQQDAIDVAVDGVVDDATGRVRVSGTDLYYLATPVR